MSDFGRLQEMARAAGLTVSPPSVVDVPYVSPEAATVGETLSCTMGNWGNMDAEPHSYAYQWLSDGVEVGTGASYTTAAAGVVSCVVTATNTAGSVAAPPSNAVTVAPAAARAAESATRTRTTHTETTR